MNNLLLFIVFTLLLLVTQSLCANILVLHPIFGGSHVLSLRLLSEELAARGHTVHIVRWKDVHSYGPFKSGKISETVLAMDNEDGRIRALTGEKEASFQVPHDVLWGSSSPLAPLRYAADHYPMIYKHCDTLLSNKELIQFLRSAKFDVALVDLLINECSLVLLDELKVPAIGYWAYSFSASETDFTTAFLPPSHVPVITSRLTHRMSFAQRVFNTFIKIANKIFIGIQCQVVHSAAKANLKEPRNPCDLFGELSGMLINTDYALDYPRLLPPTFVNIGGPGKLKPDPLPTDLEDFIQSSDPHGVILFTPGFIFDTKLWPETVVQAFTQAFSRLPQKVLMKYGGNTTNFPKNVMALDFLPQQDILAHPKMKLFITHCGARGVFEALYNAVPMVGMPMFWDQEDIMVKLLDRGVAVALDKAQLTADAIYEAVQDVLNNPTYKENAVKLSKIMKDNPNTPAERGINLIEFIARHDGAEHLKLASKDLNFLQYFCIDAILFLIFLGVGVGYMTWKLVVIKYTSWFNGGNTKVTSKTKKLE